MSMDRCSDCGKAVDTDFDTDFYTFSSITKSGHGGYCEHCRENKDKDMIRVKEFIDTMQKIQNDIDSYGIDSRVYSPYLNEIRVIFKRKGDMHLYKLIGRYKEEMVWNLHSTYRLRFTHGLLPLILAISGKLLDIVGDKVFATFDSLLSRWL